MNPSGYNNLWIKGGYANRIKDTGEITCGHLISFYNLYEITRLDDEQLLLWLQKERLIRKDYVCSICESPCYMFNKKGRVLGKNFVCQKTEIIASLSLWTVSFQTHI